MSRQNAESAPLERPWTARRGGRVGRHFDRLESIDTGLARRWAGVLGPQEPIPPAAGTCSQLRPGFGRTGARRDAGDRGAGPLLVLQNSALHVGRVARAHKPPSHPAPNAEPSLVAEQQRLIALHCTPAPIAPHRAALRPVRRANAQTRWRPSPSTCWPARGARWRRCRSTPRWVDSGSQREAAPPSRARTVHTRARWP